jgi:hypothetical protein
MVDHLEETTLLLSTTSPSSATHLVGSCLQGRPGKRCNNLHLYITTLPSFSGIISFKIDRAEEATTLVVITSAAAAVTIYNVVLYASKEE